MYMFTSLALAPHVGLAKVRATPGVIECFRSPLDRPVLHLHVICSSYPISSILDNNSECDPLRSFVFARDRPEGLEVFLEAVIQDVAGRPPRLGPCTTSRPNMTRFESFESPCRIRAPANPSFGAFELSFRCVRNRSFREHPHPKGVQASIFPVDCDGESKLYYEQLDYNGSLTCGFKIIFKCDVPVPVSYVMMIGLESPPHWVMT